MSTLVILSHPALHRSRINAHLAEIATRSDTKEVLDLYDAYPDFEIDVPREQERLRSADTIVLQYPFYWYSTPSLLKEWLDLVWEHGFAYGSNGTALVGKTLTLAVSTGADGESYRSEGLNRFTIGELLRPMEATAHFCGMRWVEPFVTHSGHVITDADIAVAGERYGAWLNGLATQPLGKEQNG